MNATQAQKITKIDALGYKHTYRLFTYGDGSNKLEDWTYDANGVILSIKEFHNLPQANIKKIFS